MGSTITIGDRKFFVRMTVCKHMEDAEREIIKEKVYLADTVLLDKAGCTHFCSECILADFKDLENVEKNIIKKS